MQAGTFLSHSSVVPLYQFSIKCSYCRNEKGKPSPLNLERERTVLALKNKKHEGRSHYNQVYSESNTVTLQSECSQIPPPPPSDDRPIPQANPGLL